MSQCCVIRVLFLCETLGKIQKAGLSMICHCENLPELIMKCMTSAILKDPQTSNRGVYMQLIM